MLHEKYGKGTSHPRVFQKRVKFVSEACCSVPKKSIDPRACPTTGTQLDCAFTMGPLCQVKRWCTSGRLCGYCLANKPVDILLLHI